MVQQVRGSTAFVEGRSSVPCTQSGTHNIPYFISFHFQYVLSASTGICTHVFKYMQEHIHAIESKVVVPLFHLWLYPSVEYV